MNRANKSEQSPRTERADGYKRTPQMNECEIQIIRADPELLNRVHERRALSAMGRRDERAENRANRAIRGEQNHRAKQSEWRYDLNRAKNR
jgi:hypothetical protein